MEIVGIEGGEGVHTIDMWYSSRRRCWVVERRDHHGAMIGPSFCAPEEGQAIACLTEWLRTHDETHLVGRTEQVATEAAKPRVSRAA